ncbi:hypothetical protein JCM10212_003328 [Sporobolomyces blumeae]
MSGFFTKIAHSPHVNLGDFKQLHEVISSEKKSIDSTQRLSGDRTRASNALRDWGYVEGDDLGDVLAKVSQLYDYLAQAELAYAEHSSQYRLKFKEIRTMEENLSTLRRSRDQQGGKIEAQERKVSKMKEEHKDLPAAKQRLRELRDEMVGLENSVLAEDTRLGDFKRSAIREGLSLKLGALLELSEKTTIIAELGKLMVDELPTQTTMPGHPRAHYDGYERTEYLLREAQRCLQGVTFNPAPISEPYGTQEGTDSGTQHQTQYGDDPAVRSNDFAHGSPSTPQQNQFGSMASFQTPASSAFAQQGSAVDSPYGNSPRTSESQVNSNTYSAEQPHPPTNQPLGLSGPQLQPLPDFQRLSISGATPRGEHPPSLPSSSSLPPPVGGRNTNPEPVTEGYASNSPALAPPAQEGAWGRDRTSLAYLGEAPSSDGGHGDIEAREAQQAFEDEARSKEGSRQDWGYGSTARGGPSAERQLGDSTNKRDEGGLATISEAMLEASPMPEQTSTVPIPSPDVPADVQSQPSIDYVSRDANPEKDHPSYATTRSISPHQDVQVPITAVDPPAARPTSPSMMAPAPVPLPIPSPLHTSPPASPVAPQATSGFEPRPITPRSASGTRQPISIRPQPPSNLGSKYGDIHVPGQQAPTSFVPSAPSPGLRVTNPSYSDGTTPGSSGYFTPAGTSINTTTTTATNTNDGKRTISAGAFRRPAGAPTAVSSSTPGINVNGGRSFAPSGYNVGPGSPGFGPPADAGPSDAEQIARHWRSSSVTAAGLPQPGDQPLLDDGDLGATPSFDTRPLQVNRNRMSMGGLGRPGTVPPGMSNGAPHMRSASGPGPSLPQGARQSFDDASGSTVSQVAPSYHSQAPPPPPSQQAYPSSLPTSPVSPTGSSGFGANRFVTRLD